MRLFEIAGNTEEEVYASITRIMAMLITCSIARPGPAKDRFILKYTADLHKDNENLLNWVTRSKRIADVYYKIPEQYRR